MSFSSDISVLTANISEPHFADGREYVFDRPKCEKCFSTNLDIKYAIKKNEDTVRTETCLSCGHVAKETWKHTKSEKEKIDPNYEEDRKRFCVPYVEAIQWRIDMQELEKIFNEIKGQDKIKNNIKL